MKKIIIDTNFLMIPYQFRVDIFSEFNRICAFNYKLFVIEKTIDELRNIIQKQPGKNRKAAEFALKLIGLKNIGIIASEERDADSSILKIAGKDIAVATQDGSLRKRLMGKGVSVIGLRQKKYLQYFEGKAL